MATENPESKRKGGGGKLSRSEVVTVRLDPQMRYLADLAGRIHRRTLSSYIEWAVKNALDRESIRPVSLKGLEVSDHTIGSETEYLWDVDDADRFAKLALRYPYLLTHDEQILWKLIRECGYLWIGHHDHGTGMWIWRVEDDSLVFERLREHWANFNAVASGEADKSVLPTWPKRKPEPGKPASGFDDMDDEPPF
jgi:hypothetical protein